MVRPGGALPTGARTPSIPTGPFLALATLGWTWLAVLALLALGGLPVRRHHFESAGLVLGAGLLIVAARAWWVSRDDATPWGPPRVSVAGTAAVAALGGIAFAWTIVLGPLSDDFVLAGWARTGQWLPGTWPYVRPLPLVTWAAVFGLGGSWAAVHVLNVALHAANTALVARLAQRRLGQRAGLAAGILFALFPGNVEAVAWNAGVFDLMSTCFVLVALWTAPRSSTSVRAGAVFVLSCAAALLSKEIAVVIPVLLLLDVGWGHAPRSRLRAAVIPLVASAGIVAGYVLLRTLSSAAMAGHLANLPAGRRAWKDLVVRPFSALGLPVRSDTGLGVEHDLVGVAVLVLIGAILWAAWKARADGARDAAAAVQGLSYGGLWVLVTALPLLLQFYVSPSMEGGRYLYLPSAGFVIALAAALVPRPTRTVQTVTAAAFLTLVVVFAGRLAAERVIWREAASVRDGFLQQAAALAQAHACGTLSVEGAPDNHRGVYVFREGLADALRATLGERQGDACAARWNGTVLERVP